MSMPARGQLNFMQPQSDGFALGTIGAHIVPSNARGQGQQTTPVTATGKQNARG